MSETIERVIKALDATRYLSIGASSTNKAHMAVWDIHTRECVADGFADDKAASYGLRAYRARAAIEAMREPTEAMKKAGAEWASSHDEPVYPHQAGEVWEAMIDAARGKESQ